MFITTAICTWNNSRLLDRTLNQLQNVEVPEGVEWEVIVVNNNSTDDTDEVIERYSSSLPIRRIVESQQGQSHARNAAVAAAQGDLIIWTDDDVLIDRQWLAKYAEVVTQNPEVSFFGGPIIPLFEGDPPKWIEGAWSSLSNVFAVRELGDRPFFFEDATLPYGANFAVRTDIQRRFLYDPSLGRKKKGMLGGDETTVLRSMMSEGLTGLWIPDATLEHIIPENRQTISYVRRYHFGQGEVLAIRQHEAKQFRTWKATLRFYLGAIFLETRFRVRRLLGKAPEQWVVDMIRSSAKWGECSRWRVLKNENK